jgi:outer membrane protein
MRKIWAAAVVSFGLMVPNLAAGQTLADALISAYKSSNLLAQNQAVLRAAAEDEGAAFARLLPVLQYSAARSVSNLSNAPSVDVVRQTQSLTASLTLFAGGQGRNGVAIAREAVMATRAALIGVEQQVLLDAVSAYVDFGLQSEIVALRESNVRLISKQLRAAEDRFDVGEVTLTDVSLAEARLAAASAGLAAAQGTRDIARERYKAAIGAYPDSLARLPNLPALPATLDEVRAIAKTNHPAILQAQSQVKIATLQTAVARGAFAPEISASIGVSEDMRTGVDTTTGALQLSQTLYAGGGAAAALRKTQAQSEGASAGLLQAALTIDENVGRAWAALMVANASIRAGEAQVVAAQKAFDGVSEEANLGSRTTLDVLNSEQELLAARAAKLEAEANRYVGVYQLLAVMGQLTADKLNLGIPTYDVQAYYNSVKNAPPVFLRPSKQGAALDRIAPK